MSSQWVDLPAIGTSGVTSLNGLTGALNLVEGTGITITPSGLDITIAATGTSLTFSDSLVNNSGVVTLVNDSETPGNSKYYGTNGSGILGYYALPGSGSGITQLTGDVTAGPGSGSQAATVASVGGKTASAIAAAVSTVQAANSIATAGTLPLIGGMINNTFLCVDAVIGPDGPGNYTTMDLSGGQWLGFDGNAALDIGDHYNALDRLGNISIGWSDRYLGDGDNNTVAAWGNTGDFDFSVAHIEVTSLTGTPTASASTGAGTGGTATVNEGGDTGFNVTIVTGTLPSVSSVVASILFAIPYNTNPSSVTFSAGNAAAALALSTFYMDDSSISTTGFNFNSGLTALPAATTLIFHVKVFE